MNLKQLPEEQENEVQEESVKKKAKEGVVSDVKHEIKLKSPVIKSERCNICRQYSDEVPLYNGHPNNSVEEYIALTDERLMIFTGDEANLDQQDERPTHKITYFSVYDKNGHLCPFDTGLIEGNKLIYFSGYVKPIYDEDTSTDNGIPTKDLGPINEWFISGFDGGEKALVGFSTAYAEYFLQMPSVEYRPIIETVEKKIYMAKIVIEFLLDEGWQNPTYEDLLQRLEATGDSELTEETLLRHAQFVCDQVTSFDSSGQSDEELLITAPCMRALVKMAGVTFQKRQKMRRLETKGIKKSVSSWSKATTTNLVQEVFEAFFVDQLDKKGKDDKGPRRKRCGVCEPCQTPDCGKCTHCQDMLKFGGTGRSKQACQLRRCPNMAIQVADEESDGEEEQTNNGVTIENNTVAPCSKRIIHNVEWVGKPIVEHDGRVYYNAAKIDDVIVEPYDYVMLNSQEPNKPLLIARVGYMWEEPLKGTLFHAHMFCRGSDTVLGETADPREIFMVDECDNCPVGSIVRKAQVHRRKLPGDWALNGGLDRLPPPLEDNGQTFFYMKHYNSECSRFEDIVEVPEDTSLPYTPCRSCRHRIEKVRMNQPKLKDGVVLWSGDTYKIGNAVFMDPETFPNKTNGGLDQAFKKENVDNELYPEFYRKPADNQKGSNVETPDAFYIGLIEDIHKGLKKEIVITVRKFYRPEQTQSSIFASFEQDLNLVYWSDEEYDVSFEQVKGKCYLAFGDSLEIPAREWATKGPYRFYFTQAYESETGKYADVPARAYKIGVTGKGKGKGKGKSNKPEVKHELPPQWEYLKNPLKCMDVFAGCGGLSEGLHQAGVVETKWAIEKEAAAAHAFKLNNPDATVYTDDCNELLSIAMSGKQRNGRTLPLKGEVEMLVGGPPCQGFSGMNRFNAGQYSLFKNSLIVSYLSYCDYYRPHYFILENVRNFVSFKRSMVLKLTLRCLLAIGYQVTFGVLQAGNYGIPQTRRRLIIIAAAPGYVLPKYPEPLHVFNKKGCQLSVPVDNHKYYTGVRWSGSAPYRTITVRDAMSDLPDIKNGCNLKEMVYDSEAMSHFQRMMRGNDPSGILRDHICKEMAPLVEGRMAQIPLHPGSDWRDLPNIVTRLSDGSYTNKLRYPHRSKKQNKGDSPRGVCFCATGKGCDPADRQFNTLIPWCLPHTGDRHNNWAGLYGRLEWDGFFSTTVTNPEPMGKQGRVLHPEQHRVVSVRECARSQGFPDRYQFYGSILDKHRQVGNAVPPPLGAAIGREIRNAMLLTERNQI